MWSRALLIHPPARRRGSAGLGVRRRARCRPRACEVWRFGVKAGHAAVRLKIGQPWNLGGLGEAGVGNWGGCERILSSRQLVAALKRR